jgi:flagella basal body P-ring formation protein FlgA
MALAGELARQAGLPRDADLAIVIQGDMPVLETDTGSRALPQVERATWDQRSGRFEALVALAATSGQRRPAIRIVGTATEMIEAVVPVRALNRGEPMRAADLVIERRPRAEAGNDALTDLRAATAMVPRRALRPGQPLRSADLTKPDLVARNETVTLTYDIPGIALTVRGKALEAGAEGDTISVVNVQSKRTIQAIVTGPGRVSVGPARVETAASANDVTGAITRR